VNPYGVLAAAAVAWSQTRERLQADTELAVSLHELRQAAPGSEPRDRAAEAAARVLTRLLPGRLSASEGRFAGPVADVAVEGFYADDLVVLVLDGHAMVGPILGPIRRRLLAAPSLGAGTVQRRGGDPQSRGLIRLRASGGELRLPAFQFTVATAPWPVVLEVSGILDAEHDPWGTADWWLSGNSWLDGEAPAQMLGAGRDDQLADVARHLLEGQ
jgi:hypothetical protein